MNAHGIQSNLTANVEIVTPKRAEELLAKNTHNRNVKRGNLQKVVKALQNGEWVLNGEAIKVARDGTVLDGQHRLLAIVETGISMQTLVITGLENRAQETMDGGSSRTAADALRLRGEPNSSQLAAIAKKIHVYEELGFRAALSNSYVATVPEVVSCAERHDLGALVNMASKVGIAARISPSVAVVGPRLVSHSVSENQCV